MLMAMVEFHELKTSQSKAEIDVHLVLIGLTPNVINCMLSARVVVVVDESSCKCLCRTFSLSF